MARAFLNRLLQAIPVVAGIVVLAFLLIRLVPGDPVRTQLGTTASPEAVAYWRGYYGLDLPVWQQFRNFLGQVLHLDLGDSIQLRQPVIDVITRAAGPSLLLLLVAIVISLAVATPLAIYSALRANGYADNAIKLVMMVSFAMPSFWIGLILVLVFSIYVDFLPTSGLGTGFGPMLKSLILPALTIALGLIPVITRSLRSAVIDSLQADYVEAATARGLSRPRVLLRYVLRTSLLSTVTVLGVNIGLLLGGTVIVENVFAIPGIGTVTVNAVSTRDFPVIQGCVLFIGAFVVLCNLLADMTNVALDPRIRV